MTEPARFRIAILWVFQAVITSGHCIMWTWEPGMVDRLVRTGDIYREALAFVPMPTDGYPPQLALVLLSLLWIIPAIVAYLTLSLSVAGARRTNYLGGGLMLAFNIYHITPSCSAWAHGILTCAFTVVITMLVLWHARGLGSAATVGPTAGSPVG